MRRWRFNLPGKRDERLTCRCRSEASTGLALAFGNKSRGPAERDRYLSERERGLRDLGPEDAYPGARTPGYERTGFTAARFNRVVAYRSFTLHSGIVEDPDILSDDPSKGRLTANFFVDYRPA